MKDTIFDKSIKEVSIEIKGPFKATIISTIIYGIAIYILYLSFSNFFDYHFKITILIEALAVCVTGFWLSDISQVEKHPDTVGKIASIIIHSISLNETASKNFIKKINVEKVFDSLRQEIDDYEEEVFRFPKILLKFSGIATLFIGSGVLLSKQTSYDFKPLFILFLGFFPFILFYLYRVLLQINIIKKALSLAEFDFYVGEGHPNTLGLIEKDINFAEKSLKDAQSKLNLLTK